MGYLKVEYLTDSAGVFNCTKHGCRSLGALPKTYTKLGVIAIFFAKSTGRCFTPLIEIKHYSFRLRWNFYADIQLFRWRFWVQLWTVKKLSQPRVSWKYLAKVWKIRKCRVVLQRGWTAFSSTARRRPPAGGKANILVGVTNSNGGQIVNNVFVTLNGYKEIALYFS